jgi:lactate dehydrogenase-like 2-hydroxyacid dehydrogenase
MAKLPRVFITRTLPPETLGFLEGHAEAVFGPAERPATAEELRSAVREADALVPMLSDKIDGALLREGGRLKIVASYAAGFNHIDFTTAESLGIWVTNTPDATTDATADLAIGLMIAAGRKLFEGEKQLREGKFIGWAPTTFLGVLFSGSTMGIDGLGHIGKAVARRAQAFGMRVVYCSGHRLPEDEERKLGVSWRPIEQLLAESDVVSLHCPLTEKTRHLIDEAALRRMKPTALLVNASRGPVVDEEALARALHEGRLGGAALDVYEQEPKVHPLLLSAPRAVLVPHLGTSTMRTRLLMAEKALGDVVRVLEGKDPLYPVNHPASPRR